MTDRGLRHLFSGKQRHHPDFTIVPEFKDIISVEDRVQCQRSRAAIDVLERNAEAFIAHATRDFFHEAAMLTEWVYQKEVRT